jgi:hypothetical protein
MNAYDLGDIVLLTASFSTVGGLPVTPDTVDFKIKRPDGVVELFHYPATVISPALGTYTVDYVPSQSGTHLYRAEATGTGQSGSEGDFYIRDSNF